MEYSACLAWPRYTKPTSTCHLDAQATGQQQFGLQSCSSMIVPGASRWSLRAPGLAEMYEVHLDT
jgi:hypothetical protein